MGIDIQAVAECIEEAARTLVLPRFARLSAGDVESKQTSGDADDIVTIVDREVEAHLSTALNALDPTANVIGEEAAHRRPELLGLLAGDRPLWIIDPIDGTKNFVRGDDAFGVMVAYVAAGRTEAAWIVLPARRQTFVAQVGGGAFVNGKQIRVPSVQNDRLLRGAALTRYMPGNLGDQVTQALYPRIETRPPSGCAAIEYTDILEGHRDFVVYYRLLPWDHAAPALMLTEAGGFARHISGRSYSPRSESQLTIVARDADAADRLRTWLLDAIRS